MSPIRTQEELIENALYEVRYNARRVRAREIQIEYYRMNVDAFSSRARATGATDEQVADVIERARSEADEEASRRRAIGRNP